MRSKEQDEIIIMLRQEGKSLRKIGKIVNCSYEKVRKILYENGIKSYAQKRIDKQK